MSRKVWGPRWARSVKTQVSANQGPRGPGWKDLGDKMRNNPDLRKRWAEKSSVTKRAQKQKVSLAPVPSLDRGAKDSSHDNPTEANVSSRHEMGCHAR
jgi:hypothetical protein